MTPLQVEERHRDIAKRIWTKARVTGSYITDVIAEALAHHEAEVRAAVTEAVEGRVREEDAALLCRMCAGAWKHVDAKAYRSGRLWMHNMSEAGGLPAVCAASQLRAGWAAQPREGGQEER